MAGRKPPLSPLPPTDFGRTLRSIMDGAEPPLTQAAAAALVARFDPEMDSFQISKYTSGTRPDTSVPKPSRVGAIARAFPQHAEKLWAAWRRDEVRKVAFAEGRHRHHYKADRVPPGYEAILGGELPASGSNGDDPLVHAARELSAAIPEEAAGIALALERIAGRPELAKAMQKFMAAFD